MESITVNGKEYVLKADADAELKSVKEKIEKNGGKVKGGFQFVSSDFSFMNEANVMAIAHVNIGKGFVVTRVSTEYVEKVVKCLIAMSLTKHGMDAVDLAWGPDHPAIFGTVNDDGEMTGFVIAPRTKDTG